MTKITENTTISLTVLGAMIGGIYWLSSMYYQTQANANGIEEIRKSSMLISDKDQNFREEVLTRLSRIETRLEKRK